jgi:hypothetical protein
MSGQSPAVSLYRVHAYDDEHYATLVIRAHVPEEAGRVARQFVAMMHLGYYPANHEREFPEVVRVEQAASYFDAAEPFLPVVESIQPVDEAALDDV